MPPLPEWIAPWFLPALAMMFFTAMFQGTTGFGMALICTPLLAAITGTRTAVECITLVATTTTATIAYSYRAHWDLKRALWLGAPLLAGTPVGVLLLKYLTDKQLNMGVGVVLLFTSGTYVFGWLTRRAAAADAATPEEKPAPPAHISPAVCIAVGGTSGILGGATGITGPLMANYLIRTGISRESFKVTLNLIFTASALWRSSCYVAMGMIHRQTLCTALLLIPVAVLGTHAGMRLDKRIPAEHFIPLVHVLLLGLGVWMVVSGLR